MHYSANKYPWIVAIRWQSNRCTPSGYTDHHCAPGVFQPTYEFATGTLISDLFVVTVASFYDAINDNDKEREKEKKESIRVKPGASVWAKKDCCNEILQWQEIEQEIYFHPYYKDDNYKPSNDISYNVALIKLKRRLSFYEDGVTKLGVRPICLPTPGQTRMIDLPDDQTLLMGRNLGAVEAKVLIQLECIRSIEIEDEGSNMRMLNDQICAHHKDPQQVFIDDCDSGDLETYGDLGAPIFMKENER